MLNPMKMQKLFISGSEINKLQFSEIDSYIEDLGLNVNEVFEMIADENEMIYVSNGFLRGLAQPVTDGEWHHFFKKVDGYFIAGKLQFNS